MPRIPLTTKEVDIREVFEKVEEKINDPKSQRKVVLVIVCVALLLDNMLYMVIVPIIPAYLRSIGAWDDDDEKTTTVLTTTTTTTQSPNWNITGRGFTSNLTSAPIDDPSHDASIGVLFASKALVQLFVNPFTGALIDRIGYDYPMMIGLIIMFLSTAIFAFGESYATLFVARSLQGVGSAFADTSGLGMLADRFKVESERTTALGIALAFISFGCLFAPPFGGILYDFAGKRVPFLALATVSLLDGVLLMFVMQPVRKEMWNPPPDAPLKPKGTPIWRLLMDPFIAICAGALAMSNMSLAFLEPTIATWMSRNMGTTEWQNGMVFLPGFFPHVIGVVMTVKLAKLYPQRQWLLALVGLTIEGLFTLIVPFATAYEVLIIPICGICFGIALVDTALLPTLGYIVDLRHTSVYGSIYAIADISYSFMYAFGPMISGSIINVVGFTGLNIGIALCTLLYCPIIAWLRTVYLYKPMEPEMDVVYNADEAHKYGALSNGSTDPTGQLDFTQTAPSGGTTEEPNGALRQPQQDRRLAPGEYSKFLEGDDD